MKLDKEERDRKADKSFEVYHEILTLFKKYNVDLADYTVLLSMLTVDYIELLGQTDNIVSFMDDYKILIIKQARAKRGYS